MRPAETPARNSHQTTEWLIVHIPSGAWSSLTFMKGNHSTVQVVREDGTYSMSLDNALATLAWTSRQHDFQVCEV